MSSLRREVLGGVDATLEAVWSAGFCRSRSTDFELTV